MADSGYNIRYKEIIGHLKGWDKVETSDQEHVPTPKDVASTHHVLTAEELLIILRELKRQLDPDKLLRLERIIQLHISDYNNPHRTTLEQLATSVINELYKEWLQYKNRKYHGELLDETALRDKYSTAEFLKEIFQYLIIANRETALKGESTSEITNVYDVAQMIEQHNYNEDAHEVIFKKIFPGRVLEYEPSYSVTAVTELPINISVTRNSSILYLDANGLYKSAPNNTLPVCWSQGYPAYPIFGQRTNIVNYSNTFTNNYWTKTLLTVSSDTTVLDPFGNTSQKITTSADTSPKEHFISATIPSTSMTTNTISLCCSIFVQPGTAEFVGLICRDASASVVNQHDVVRFDLKTLTQFKSDVANVNIKATATKLHNGWIRLEYFTNVDNTKNYTFSIYVLDIIDGDMNYQAANQYCYISGAQIETNCSIASPPILTTSTSASTQQTTVSIPINAEWYNKVEGTLCIEITNGDDITLNINKFAYEMGTSSNYTLRGYYPANQNGRFYMSAANASNSAISSSYLLRIPYTDNTRCLAFSQSYSLDQHIYGSYNEIKEINVNDRVRTDPTTIYLGNTRSGGNPINGYLRVFSYYPKACDALQHLFLVRS